MRIQHIEQAEDMLSRRVYKFLCNDQCQLRLDSIRPEVRKTKRHGWKLDSNDPIFYDIHDRRCRDMPEPTIGIDIWEPVRQQVMKAIELKPKEFFRVG